MAMLRKVRSTRSRSRRSFQALMAMQAGQNQQSHRQGRHWNTCSGVAPGGEVAGDAEGSAVNMCIMKKEVDALTRAQAAPDWEQPPRRELEVASPLSAARGTACVGPNFSTARRA